MKRSKKEISRSSECSTFEKMPFRAFIRMAPPPSASPAKVTGLDQVHNPRYVAIVILIIIIVIIITFSVIVTMTWCKIQAVLLPWMLLQSLWCLLILLPSSWSPLSSSSSSLSSSSPSSPSSSSSSPLPSSSSLLFSSQAGQGHGSDYWRTAASRNPRPSTSKVNIYHPL